MLHESGFKLLRCKGHNVSTGSTPIPTNLNCRNFNYVILGRLDGGSLAPERRMAADFSPAKCGRSSGSSAGYRRTFHNAANPTGRVTLTHQFQFGAAERRTGPISLWPDNCNHSYKAVWALDRTTYYAKAPTTPSKRPVDAH